jgi:hypothetical protein
MKLTMGWPVLALLVAGTVGSACSSPGRDLACPGIGVGGPDLQVGVHQFAAVHPHGVRVTVCVGDQCGRTTLVGPKTTVSAVVGPVVADVHPVELTLIATDAATGKILTTLHQSSAYSHVEPFGKGCGFLYRSYHTLTATGALTDSSPMTQPR